MTNSTPGPLISVVIPVREDPVHLRRALAHLQDSTFSDFEIIVVDDASPDSTAAVALEMGASLISMEHRGGPAAARNRGVKAAKGEYVVFVDADVCVYPETLGLLARAFVNDPTIVAVFGSYDVHPGARNVISQYRNLLHHYVHQVSSESAGTFWAGCGAIKRSVFESVGGFNTAYTRPCIEDIELGRRICMAGCRIQLHKGIQVTHWKRWTLWGMIKSDIWRRALPWTKLILRSRKLPNDLNLKVSQRMSAVLACCLLATFVWGAWLQPVLLVFPPVILLGILAVDFWSEKRAFPVAAKLLAVAAVLISGATIAFLFKLWTLVPVVLVLGVILANKGFYSFLGRERGPMFAAFALPLHIGYFVYSSFAFALGACLLPWTAEKSDGRL